MSAENSLPSERVGVLATVDPVSTATTVTTGWVNMSNFLRLLAIIDAGVFGASATVDAKLQQATSSGGAGSKDVTGKAITQLVAATGNNQQALINLRAEELDVTNGFQYVRLSITVGTAASLVQGILLGFDPRLDLGSTFNQAGVTNAPVA